MRSSWIIQVVPKSNDMCPYRRHTDRRGEDTDTHRQKRRGCDQGSRDWSDAPTNQETLAAAKRWKRHRTDFPIVPLEGVLPYQHLDFSSQSPELRKNRCMLFEATNSGLHSGNLLR